MAGPRSSLIVPLLATAILAAWHAAHAVAGEGAQPGRPVVHSTPALSLDQAIKMAEQRYKARVVRAESQQSEGRTIYVLRLLNESGRVWTVHVDAASGSVL
ncbi:MAG TPA: PepSY domain-containing protein [Steroidobacteraceae bacterium]|nr:PepSY domain-containing protein [Steroidobacteraceae bacterium]